MPSPSPRAVVWIAAFVAWGACYAQGKSVEKKNAAPLAKTYESPTAALAALQMAHGRDDGTFVVQGELDELIHPDGGGACASAAGVDPMQSLRVMAGLDKHPFPHEAALLAFKNQPDLLAGRVTNDQFVKLIAFFRPQLAPAKLGVDVVSAPNSGYRTHQATWPEDGGPDSSVVPRKLRVVSYTATEPTGKSSADTSCR